MRLTQSLACAVVGCTATAVALSDGSALRSSLTSALARRAAIDPSFRALLVDVSAGQLTQRGLENMVAVAEAGLSKRAGESEHEPAVEAPMHTYGSTGQGSSSRPPIGSANPYDGYPNHGSFQDTPFPVGFGPVQNKPLPIGHSKPEVGSQDPGHSGPHGTGSGQSQDRQSPRGSGLKRRATNSASTAKNTVKVSQKGSKPGPQNKPSQQNPKQPQGNASPSQKPQSTQGLASPGSVPTPNAQVQSKKGVQRRAAEPEPIQSPWDAWLGDWEEGTAHHVAHSGSDDSASMHTSQAHGKRDLHARDEFVMVSMNEPWSAWMANGPKQQQSSTTVMQNGNGKQQNSMTVMQSGSGNSVGAQTSQTDGKRDPQTQHAKAHDAKAPTAKAPDAKAVDAKTPDTKASTTKAHDAKTQVSPSDPWAAWMADGPKEQTLTNNVVQSGSGNTVGTKTSQTKTKRDLQARGAEAQGSMKDPWAAWMTGAPKQQSSTNNVVQSGSGNSVGVKTSQSKMKRNAEPQVSMSDPWAAWMAGGPRQSTSTSVTQRGSGNTVGVQSTQSKTKRSLFGRAAPSKGKNTLADLFGGGQETTTTVMQNGNGNSAGIQTMQENSAMGAKSATNIFTKDGKGSVDVKSSGPKSSKNSVTVNGKQAMRR